MWYSVQHHVAFLLGSLASNAASPYLIANPGYDTLKDCAANGLIGVAPIVATTAKDSPHTMDLSGGRLAVIF